MASNNELHIAALKTYSVPPIHYEDHIVQAVQQLMHGYYVQLLEWEGASYDDKTMNALRQMSTIVGHLQVLLELVEDYMDAKMVKRLGKRLRKLQSRLSDVLELDMMIRDLLQYGEAATHRMTVAGIVAHLDGQRQVAHARALKYLKKKKKYADLKKILDYVVTNPPDEVFETEGQRRHEPYQVMHVLPVIIHERLAVIRTYGRELPLTDWELYDEVYERLQQFQYLLLNFEPILGETCVAYLSTIARVQDKLDRLTDINQTLLRLIHMPRISLDGAQVEALKDYRRDLRVRREKLIAEFPTHWIEFHMPKTQEQLMRSLLTLM